METTPDRPRIFIVEDEALIAMELSQRLLTLGYNPCGQATNGQAALARTRQERPDLVLMDIQLPGGMSGIETAEQIRAQLDTPVLFLTAYSDPETVDQALRTAPYGYLVKPFDEGALRAAIEIALHKHGMEKDLLKANRLLEQRNEELERERRRALDAERAQGDFLATMSHEIRTPLHAILGMTELLLDSRLDEEQAECANGVHSASRALLTIVNDILDFSKIEANRIEFEIAPFDLWAKVEEVAELLVAEAEAKDLDLVVEWPIGLPRQVRGDCGRLRQVLVNLVGNALKFTARGHIRIKVDSAPRACADAVRDFHFSVEDTGCGIAANMIPLLFERFRQVDNSVSRKSGGTGLGLAICKKLVEGMGGTVCVDSQPGEGSTFHVNLALEVVSGGQDPSPAAAACAGLRVLLAARCPLARRLLSAAAVELGMEIVAAGDLPSDCVASSGILHAPFDLAIFDSAHFKGAPSGIWQALLDGPHGVPPLILLQTSRDRELAIPHPFVGLHAPLSPAKIQHALTRARSLAAREASSAFGAGARRHDALVEMRDPQRSLGLHLLVVEDNLLNQRVISRLLGRLGCRVDLASSGADALRMLQLTSYDAIFMDVQMPEMSGYETTGHIRTLPGPASQTPVIALTASVFPGDKEACLRAGMNDYLSKPVDTKDLSRLLDRWAHRKVVG